MSTKHGYAYEVWIKFDKMIRYIMDRMYLFLTFSISTLKNLTDALILTFDVVSSVYNQLGDIIKVNFYVIEIRLNHLHFSITLYMWHHIHTGITGLYYSLVQKHHKWLNMWSSSMKLGMIKVLIEALLLQVQLSSCSFL